MDQMKGPAQWRVHGTAITKGASDQTQEPLVAETGIV
jgi:hypothetical protein